MSRRGIPLGRLALAAAVLPPSSLFAGRVGRVGRGALLAGQRAPALGRDAGRVAAM
ncbi:hypothetical protein ACMHYB_50040 [Sorangium sp. So ce1128]